MKGITIEDLPEKFRAQVRAQLGNRVAVQTPIVERSVEHEPVAEKEVAGFARRVHIHVHSRLKRARDCDSTSCKYLVDSLVSAGILKGDDAAHVKAVTFSQEKSKEDQTLITITEVT